MQIGLFTDELALMAIIVDEPKENINQKTEYEVKRLRFPLTLNPLALIKVKDVTPLSELMNLTSGTFKTLGILVSARQIKTKKGDQMAFATLSNYSDWLNLVIFPNTFKALKENLLTNEIYVVTGHLEVKNDEKQLIVQTIERYINE